MATLKYVWDPVIDAFLLETDGSDATQAVYTAEPVYYGRAISQRRNSTTNYMHQDALGSTHHLTNASKSITDSWVYDAYGKELGRTGSTSMFLTWVGELGYYHDAESMTHHVRRRSYISELAAWKSRDLIELPRGAAAYSYGDNRPTTFTDPSGQIPVEKCQPNRKACIEDVVKELKKRTEAGRCFKRGKEGCRKRQAEDERKCRNEVEACFLKYLDSMPIHCANPGAGATALAAGPCWVEKSNSRKIQCQWGCNPIADPSCSACSNIPNSRIDLGAGALRDGYVWDGDHETGEISSTWCQKAENRNRLAIKLLHEMMHHCVGGGHASDEKGVNCDQCGRPFADRLVTDFLINCGK